MPSASVAAGSIDPLEGQSCHDHGTSTSSLEEQGVNTVKKEPSTPVPVHAPDGAVDLNNSHALRKLMHTQIEAGARAIVLDLHSVRYVDSSGLATLVGIAAVLEKRGGSLLLCSVHDAVLKLLETTRLTEYFELSETREEALERATSLQFA
jgi:anti-anti-sigma factor